MARDDGPGGAGVAQQGPLDPSGLDLDINDNTSQADHQVESVKVSSQTKLFIPIGQNETFHLDS